MCLCFVETILTGRHEVMKTGRSSGSAGEAPPFIFTISSFHVFLFKN
jgi:hypothetical protein